MIGYALTLAGINRVRRVTGGAPFTDWWIPPVSAFIAIGLGYSFVPRFLGYLTNAMFGPDSMWLIVTVPLGMVVLATVGCAIAATIVGRNRGASQ